MARPSKLDLSALGDAEVSTAPRNSSLLSGPVFDALTKCAADGQDRAYSVPEAQANSVMTRIRSTARQMDHVARITTVHLTKRGDETVETPIKQATIRNDGKRTIKIYFRVKSD